MEVDKRLCNGNSKFATKLVTYLVKNDSEGNFLDYLPDDSRYRALIQDPMTLRRVKQKLAHKKHYSLEDFIADIDQIWCNCRLYNDRSSLIVQRANTLESKAKQFIRESFSTAPVPEDPSFSAMVELSNAISFSHKSLHTRVLSFLQSAYPITIKSYNSDYFMIRVDFIPLSAYPSIHSILQSD